MKHRGAVGVAITSAVAILLGAACSAASRPTSVKVQTRNSSSLAGAVPITGASSSEDTSLRTLISQLPNGTIDSVAVAAPPPSMLVRDDGTKDTGRYSNTDVWLTVHVPDGGSKIANSVALWRAEILAAAAQYDFQDRSIVGFDVETLNSAGDVTSSDSDSTQGWEKEDPGNYLSTDDAVRTAVSEELAKAGVASQNDPDKSKLRVVSITTLASTDPVPMVELAAPDNATAITTDFGSLELQLSQYEGFLLIVDAPDGNPAAMHGYVGRVHYGFGMADPQYAGAQDTRSAKGAVHG
jgi:hypothetical protein